MAGEACLHISITTTTITGITPVFVAGQSVALPSGRQLKGIQWEVSPAPRDISPVCSAKKEKRCLGELKQPILIRKGNYRNQLAVLVQ